MKRRLVRLLVCFMLLLMVPLCSSAAISDEDILGTWSGSYTITENDKKVTKKLSLNISAIESGNFSGTAEIDSGKKGKFYFEGSYDGFANSFSFIGKHWISNPAKDDFRMFSGSINQGSGLIVSGDIMTSTGGTFDLTRISDKYTDVSVDLDQCKADYTGFYDGFANKIVVRRAIEIFITDIGPEGDIKGKAVFSEYKGEKHNFAANGSYFFSGSIDKRFGTINLKGNTWIDRPLGYKNFDFVTLEGQIDRNGHIEGVSDGGIWKMDRVDYSRYDFSSGFTLGTDNNSFTTDAGDLKKGGNKFDATSFKKLASYCTSGEMSELKLLMADEYTGLNYGIVSTMGLAYDGHLSTKGYGAGKYYGISAANSEFRELLKYYQASQVLMTEGTTNATGGRTYNFNMFSGLTDNTSLNDSASSFLRTLVRNAESGNVEFLGYNSVDGPHQMLVTGCKFDIPTSSYNLQVYDPEEQDKFRSMVIPNDFSSFVIYDGSGKSVMTSGNTYHMFFADDSGMKTLIPTASRKFPGGYHMKIIVPVGMHFKLTDSSGKYIAFSGSKYSGNLPIYNISFDGRDTKSRVIFETDEISDFTITGMDGYGRIDIVGQSDFAAISGTALKSVKVKLGRKMTLKGKNYFEAYMSSNAKDKGEAPLISISGRMKKGVTLTYSGGSMSAESASAMSSLETTVYSGVTSKITKYGSGKELTVATGVFKAGMKVADPRGNVKVLKGKKVELVKASSKTGKNSLIDKKGNAVIPDTIKLADGVKYRIVSIGSKAFAGNKKIKKVTVGKYVNSIGNGAFVNCKNIKSVNGMKNVKTIGSGAFKNCSSLAKIDVRKVKKIGKDCFTGCGKLNK